MKRAEKANEVQALALRRMLSKTEDGLCQHTFLFLSAKYLVD